MGDYAEEARDNEEWCASCLICTEPCFDYEEEITMAITKEQELDRALKGFEDSMKENNSLDKPSNLRLITGSGDGVDVNWLADIEIGTIFLARHKETDVKNPVLEAFELKWMDESKMNAYLVANEHMTGSEKKMQMYVDTLSFSRQYKHRANVGRVT